MKTRFIPALTTLIAGLISCILDICNKTDTSLMLKHLLLVLIIFYIIGLIAKAIVNQTLMADEVLEEDVDELQEMEEESEENELDSSTNDKIDE